MANVTLTIDDEILRRARIRALEHGTSVNALVRSYLSEFAGESAAHEAIAEAIDLTRELDAGSGRGGRAWTRDDAYEERTRWPSRRS